LLSLGERTQLGLRERKKAKTRAAIQRHALRLFREQGYEATTVSQIAEAAEISPSTFFRYFPTKEDVALYDDLDPVFIAAFEAQPPELAPFQAMRGALIAALASLPADEMEQQLERGRLALTVPELRMRMLDQVADSVTLMAEMLAKRLGRRADDDEILAFSGALVGALMGVFLAHLHDSGADLLALMDKTLAYLEAGMPL
jgi:AcrR family transcriptional regulator